MVIIPEKMTKMANSFMVGFSAYCLYGLPGAIATNVGLIALPKLSRKEVQSHIPLDEKTIVDLSKPWKEFGAKLFATQFLLGCGLKLCNGSIHQVAIHWIRQNLTDPFKTLQVYFQVGVVAPVLEEFFFEAFYKTEFAIFSALLLALKRPSLRSKP